MNTLNNEKILALQNQDNEKNIKYDIDKKTLESCNLKMKNISNPDNKNKKFNGIITAERTNEDYKKIWNSFLENHADGFKNYMGYGKKEIKRIGIKKFIDYMDWRGIEDIYKYITDAVKVIPCTHCRNEFTTFQIDLGLCDKCKSKYDLDKFNDFCVASDENNPGSSLGLIASFTYFEEFKKLFLKEFDLKERALLCAEEDNFNGLISREFILHILDDEIKVNNFINLIKKHEKKLDFSTKGRFESIEKILKSNNDIETKKNKIYDFFKK